MQEKNTRDLVDKKDLINKLSVVGSGSRVNQQIANYVEKNYTSIVFLTADQLSKKIGVSQGSISRFCIKMGYEGYNSFLRYLQKIVSSEITAPKRRLYLDEQKSDNSSILDQEFNNLSELGDIVKSKNYGRIVELLAKSKQVILLSNRMSATLLPYMNYILSKLRVNVTWIQDGTPAWDSLDLQDVSNTVIFTVVFPRYSKSLLKKLDRLYGRGFKIIAMTDSHLSPVNTLADETLVTPITISSIFDVYSTPLLLINLLMRDVAKAIPNIKYRLDTIEKQNQENDAFF